MATLIEIGMMLAMIAAGFAFGICLVSWLGRWRERPETIRSTPQEPCWTEAIASDGRRRFERSQCVDAVLMSMDARAARGDFPIPRQY